MADGNLQHSIFHAVVNGQRNSNRRNFDIAHDAAAGNIKQVLVIGSIFLGGLNRILFLLITKRRMGASHHNH